MPKSLSRSRGELTSKLHVVADAQGRYARVGQRHDAPKALLLLDGLVPAYLIADCSYDPDPLVAALVARGTRAIIPPRCKRRYPKNYDTTRYAQRHPVERLFSHLKQFCRVATQ